MDKFQETYAKIIAEMSNKKAKKNIIKEQRGSSVPRSFYDPPSMKNGWYSADLKTEQFTWQSGEQTGERTFVIMLHDISAGGECKSDEISSIDFTFTFNGDEDVKEIINGKHVDAKYDEIIKLGFNPGEVKVGENEMTDINTAWEDDRKVFGDFIDIIDKVVEKMESE